MISDLTAGLILLAVYVRCAPIVPSDQEKIGYAACSLLPAPCIESDKSISQRSLSGGITAGRGSFEKRSDTDTTLTNLRGKCSNETPDPGNSVLVEVMFIWRRVFPNPFASSWSSHDSLGL